MVILATLSYFSHTTITLTDFVSNTITTLMDVLSLTIFCIGDTCRVLTWGSSWLPKHLVTYNLSSLQLFLEKFWVSPSILTWILLAWITFMVFLVCFVIGVSLLGHLVSLIFSAFKALVALLEAVVGSFWRLVLSVSRVVVHGLCFSAWFARSVCWPYVVTVGAILTYAGAVIKDLLTHIPTSSNQERAPAAFGDNGDDGDADEVPGTRNFGTDYEQNPYGSESEDLDHSSENDAGSSNDNDDDYNDASDAEHEDEPTTDEVPGARNFGTDYEQNPYGYDSEDSDHLSDSDGQSGNDDESDTNNTSDPEPEDDPTTNQPEPSLYAIFGVPRTATFAEIDTAYRRSTLRTHPDKFRNDTPEQAAIRKEAHVAAQKAYEVLSEPLMRVVYLVYGMAGVQDKRVREQIYAENSRWLRYSKEHLEEGFVRDLFHANE